ncbi:MAG TPA: radical SAM protein [Thermoanaerobaculia bacterium]|nr:radical SAM protein [Thermoanaerobaculia bacterium]
MRIALVTPPVAADNIHPYSSLPVLTGFLKRHGFEQVEERDLSIEGIDYLLTKSFLDRSAQRGAQSLAALGGKPALNEREKAACQILESSLRTADRTSSEVAEAKRILRQEEFYNPGRMCWARRVLGTAYNLVNGAFYPTVVGAGVYSTPEVNYTRSWEIREAVERYDLNPFMDYYDHVVLDWLARYDPGLFGISVTYQSQLIPALALVRRIKREGFKCHVVLGGGFVSFMANHQAGARLMLEYADSFVVNEGETALAQLASKLAVNRDPASLTQVNNIAVQVGGKTVRGPMQMEDIDSLAPPDFGNLFSHPYQAPDSIYLYQSSRGCYAGCAFCVVSKHQKDLGYRRRNIDLIIEDIRTLTEHNAAQRGADSDFFLFIADDTHSPPHLRKLSQRILEEGLDVRWMCEARLDKGFDQETCELMYEAGCRHMFFGMESAHERVLKIMMKGTLRRYMSDALINVASAGIGTYLSLIVGFPTETREEAEATLDFIREHEPYIFTIGLNAFVLPRGSYVHMFPEQFGVTLKPDPEADIQMVVDYDVKSGLTQQEARELALQAKSEWFSKRTLPRDFSLALFDGYTLLYLSRYHKHFVDELFGDIDPQGMQRRQQVESIRYLADSVWAGHV